MRRYIRLRGVKDNATSLVEPLARQPGVPRHFQKYLVHFPARSTSGSPGWIKVPRAFLVTLLQKNDVSITGRAEDLTSVYGPSPLAAAPTPDDTGSEPVQEYDDPC